MNKESLLTKEDIAKEIVYDLDHTVPQLIEVLNSGNLDNLDDLFVSLQNARVSTYNMHLKLQGEEFPISNAKQLKNEQSMEKLIEWIQKNHPDYS